MLPADLFNAPVVDFFFSLIVNDDQPYTWRGRDGTPILVAKAAHTGPDRVLRDLEAVSNAILTGGPALEMFYFPLSILGLLEGLCCGIELLKLLLRMGLGLR